MKIFKNKKGLYGIDYYDETGKRHREIVSTNHSAAQAELAKRQQAFYAAKSNPRIAQENQRFADLAQQFIQNHITHLASKRSYLTMFNQIKQHFEN